MPSSVKYERENADELTFSFILCAAGRHVVNSVDRQQKSWYSCGEVVGSNSAGY